MATVYRLEHVRSGLGPYRHYSFNAYNKQKNLKDKIGFQLRNHDSYKCPTPYMDGMGEIEDPKFKFGFESLEQLENWFDDTILGFFFLNFRIYVYEATYVKYGDSQVAFIPQGKRKPLTKT